MAKHDQDLGSERAASDRPEPSGFEQSPSSRDRSAEPWKTRAIWSMLVGVSSFLCFFITGVPAVILGLIALAKSEDPGTRTYAKFGVLFGLGGSLLPVGLVAWDSWSTSADLPWTGIVATLDWDHSSRNLGAVSRYAPNSPVEVVEEVPLGAFHGLDFDPAPERGPDAMYHLVVQSGVNQDCIRLGYCVYQERDNPQEAVIRCPGRPLTERDRSAVFTAFKAVRETGAASGLSNVLTNEDYLNSFPKGQMMDTTASSCR